FQRYLEPNLNSSLPAHESILREYFRILVKRKWVVLGCVAAVFSIVTIATMRATRIYEASGSIAINKTDAFMFNLKDSANGDMGYSDSTDVDTEVRILRSDLLALQVIKELNLDKRPEFGGKPSAPTQGLGMTSDELQPNSLRTSGLL